MTMPGPQLHSLSQLHLLVTGECNYECDHCFVWGCPSQGNTMTAETIEHILNQAEDLDSIEWIYFEGGEPFLYYPLLLRGVQEAKTRGFKVGIVTNAYWADNVTQALQKLQPFCSLVDDLSISDDAYHGRKQGPRQTIFARQAATQLGIPVDFISISGPDKTASQDSYPQPSSDDSTVVFRGRAADKLASCVAPKPWHQFTKCPWEDLRRPQRVHVDSLGNMHICQGISMGNLLERSLVEIMQDYAPDSHSVIGPLLAGGPAELIEHYGLEHDNCYADACHLCYITRQNLRPSFPDVLTPDQMYGS